MSDEILHPRRAKFLAVYAATCNITRAAQAAGIDRQTHYDWLDNDPEYAEQFKRAWKMAVGTLEDVAVDRGLTVSDRMLEFMLRAADPEKYRERSHQQVEGKLTLDMTLEQRMEAGRNRARPQAE